MCLRAMYGSRPVSIPGQARKALWRRKCTEEDVHREVGRPRIGGLWVYPVDLLTIKEAEEMVT